MPEEIDQYLFNCFMSGKYPDLDKDPDVDYISSHCGGDSYRGSY